MELDTLYQELIIDHGTNPRHYCKFKGHCRSEGYNPLCGDHIILYLKIENNTLVDVSFEGKGCAISTASASLMAEALIHKTIDEAQTLFKQFQAVLTTEDDFPEDIGKLGAFQGVKAFPTRIKCATLPWHALRSAITDHTKIVCTEE